MANSLTLADMATAHNMTKNIKVLATKVDKDSIYSKTNKPDNKAFTGTEGSEILRFDSVHIVKVISSGSDTRSLEPTVCDIPDTSESGNEGTSNKHV